MSFGGLAVAGAQLLGTQALMIRPQRGLKNIAYTDSNGNQFQLLDIVAQATIEERIMDKMEVTDHPVELGAAISDHSFKLPVEVTLHLAWSNSPTAAGGMFGSLVNGAVGAAAATSPLAREVLGGLNAASAAMSLLTGSGPDQMKIIYETLQQLQVTRALFDVYTGKRVLPNMVCTGLAIEGDWKNENALFARMECKEVILVSTQSVSLPANTQANPLATATPVNNGTKNASPVTQQANGTFAK